MAPRMPAVKRPSSSRKSLELLSVLLGRGGCEGRACFESRAPGEPRVLAVSMRLNIELLLCAYMHDDNIKSCCCALICMMIILLKAAAGWYNIVTPVATPAGAQGLNAEQLLRAHDSLITMVPKL